MSPEQRIKELEAENDDLKRKLSFYDGIKVYRTGPYSTKVEMVDAGKVKDPTKDNPFLDYVENMNRKYSKNPSQVGTQPT